MTNYFSTTFFVFLFFVSITIIESCCTIPSDEKYSKVKIHFKTKDEIKQLADDGLILDHSYYEREKGGFSLIVILNTYDLKILSNSDLKYDTLVDDLVEDYNERFEKE